MSRRLKRLRDLKGLGEKSEAMLESVGIHSVEAFLEADVFEIYRHLHGTMPGLSLNMLYAMMGAQEGVHWQQIARKHRTEILMRLDDMGLAPK